ncbi:MAG: DUF389 domain-containing protein, partial [Chloroflexota bacterium]
MNISEEPTSENPKSSGARRRRAKRQVISPLTPDEKTTYIEEIALKAAPSFDFFLFSLISGIVLGIGFFFDSPYILFMGALAAPLMTPAVGISLGTVLGSGRHFGRSIGGLAVGSLLVLLSTALIGLISRAFAQDVFLQADRLTQLTWPPFLVIGAAAAFTAATVVKEKRNPALPSAALAYGLYVPLAAAGFGLGSATKFIWPAGIVIFLIHLAWGTIIGAITLARMGFRPYTLFGYSIGGVIALIGILLAIGFSGAGAVLGGKVALPTATATRLPTLTPTIPPTNTPAPPTDTPLPTETFTASPIPTQTLTPTATSVEALVQSREGAVMRDEPNGLIISTSFDDSLVEVLGISQLDEFNRTWEFVLALENDVEGWILRALIATATPLAPLT